MSSGDDELEYDDYIMNSQDRDKDEDAKEHNLDPKWLCKQVGDFEFYKQRPKNRKHLLQLEKTKDLPC